MEIKKIPTVHEVYIVDLDGTLYFQKPVRRAMAFKLIGFYLSHPGRIKELFALKYYREIREKELFSGETDFEDKQFSAVAKKYGLDDMTVKKLVKYWMFKIPLSLIYENRDKKLLDILNGIKKRGDKVIVYSDYPVEEKLKILNFVPTAAYYSGDDEIGCMKPDSRGLVNILNKHARSKDQALFVGDRFEKDGECAIGAGISYCILPREKKAREDIYTNNPWITGQKTNL
ncbi:MAG: HAD-IA family hydrolase [Lachnospiraceae bacterium]|nr:HAD-IA family hydrolase [Lachnospiraceae bacterium]